jgi:hypothetical protein
MWEGAHEKVCDKELLDGIDKIDHTIATAQFTDISKLLG